MNGRHPDLPITAEEEKIPRYFYDEGPEPKIGDLGRWVYDGQKHRVWVMVKQCERKPGKHWCGGPGDYGYDDWINWNSCEMRQIPNPSSGLKNHLRGLVSP